MGQPLESASGLGFVAESDTLASMLVVALESPAEPFTRSELAQRADVPLKRLYLEETIAILETAGILEAVDGDSDEETRYVVDEDSEVYVAARQFDRALADHLPAE